MSVFHPSPLTFCRGSHSQVFQKALSGDSIRPLGVAYDPLPAVRKLFRVRGEEYQVRYGQHRAHHPYADGDQQRSPPSQPRPQRMDDGYVPGTKKKTTPMNNNRQNMCRVRLSVINRAIKFSNNFHDKLKKKYTN